MHDFGFHLQFLYGPFKHILQRTNDAAALEAWLATQRDWERGYQDRWLQVYQRR